MSQQLTETTDSGNCCSIFAALVRHIIDHPNNLEGPQKPTRLNLRGEAMQRGSLSGARGSELWACNTSQSQGSDALAPRSPLLPDIMGLRI